MINFMLSRAGYEKEIITLGPGVGDHVMHTLTCSARDQLDYDNLDMGTRATDTGADQTACMCRFICTFFYQRHIF